MTRACGVRQRIPTDRKRKFATQGAIFPGDPSGCVMGKESEKMTDFKFWRRKMSFSSDE